MFSVPIFAGMISFLAASVGIAVLGWFLTARLVGDQRKVAYRLRDLAAPAATVAEPSARAGSWAGAALPKLGALAASTRQAQVDDLRARLIHAGYFQANA